MAKVLVPLEALNKLQKKVVKERVPGSFTSTEYAEQAGLALTTARNRLRALEKSGDLTRVRICIQTGNGIITTVPGYVISDKKYSKSS